MDNPNFTAAEWKTVAICRKIVLFVTELPRVCTMRNAANDVLVGVLVIPSPGQTSD
jgi:hypothetical protein